jgi:hypothetical protein
MNETPQPPAISGQESGRQFGMALVAGLIVVLVLGGGLYWWSRSSHGAVPGAPVSLPMGPNEQTYASQIQFTDVQLSRASNMLEQEITYVDGTISNNGPRTVVEIEVSLEFHDLSQSVVFRETRRLYGTGSTPLAPGEKREFQFAFEAVPPAWDQRAPMFKITGLRLQ